LVEQTNNDARDYQNSAYGKEYLAKKEDSLLHRWKDIDVQEMKKFIAVKQLMAYEHDKRIRSVRPFWK